MSNGTRITCEDVETGETDSVVIKDDYLIVTDGTCNVSHRQHFANGTVQVTIKRPTRAGQ